MHSNSAHAPDSGLVAFPGGGQPAPESAGRTLLIHSVAVIALLVNAAYVVWRATSTLDLGVWWVSVPLLVLEAHAVAGLGLFAFSLWDVDARPPASRRVTTDKRVAVLIPTYNEPVEVLLPTVAAAVALRPVHETWVLDDGDRPEVRRLAERLGARYLAREGHDHAKAGNLNNALGVIDAELIAVLDADHVATPDFLTHTLGYFDDPRVAVVQTPQDFYNLDSFEHQTLRGRDDAARYNEQALFYRVLQPGKNRWGAAFWCGTGAVVRAAALRQVGGVATETVTEDIHTTIRFHRLGWRTVYHNEVLARGLAASDASQYSAQRLRWGTGAMQVLRAENPLWCSGLRLRQRLAYAATLLGWFDAWRSLGYLIVPVVVLLTGAVPIQADPWLFTAAFGASFVLQRIAILLLSRGRAPQLLTSVFELVRMPANLRATLTLLRRRERAFQVSHKGRVGEDRRRVPVPAVLWALLVAGVGAGVAFVLTLAGLTPIDYEVRWAAYGAAGWLVVNTLLLAVAVSRIRSERFAGERRASVRFDVDVAGSLDGTACRVQDLSLTGARVVAPAGAAHPGGGALDVEGLPVRLRTVARSARPLDDGSVLVGLQFEPGQDAEQAMLALALFNARNVPRLVAPPDAPPAGAALAPVAPLPVAVAREAGLAG
ncbi:MAG TPA: glycosyltransferase [Acidimicrobiales bacterium]|nr:glycosyltransferase [Acidimicrobiales bacterium]